MACGSMSAPVKASRSRCWIRRGRCARSNSGSRSSRTQSARDADVHGIVGDVCCLPLRDASAVTVSCLEVLEHLEDPEPAVAELARIVDGTCVVTVPWEPWFRLGSLARGKHVRRLGNHPEHLQAFRRESLRSLLDSVFSEVQVRSSFPWLVATASAPSGGRRMSTSHEIDLPLAERSDTGAERCIATGGLGAPPCLRRGRQPTRIGTRDPRGTRPSGPNVRDPGGRRRQSGRHPRRHGRAHRRSTRTSIAPDCEGMSGSRVR